MKETLCYFAFALILVGPTALSVAGTEVDSGLWNGMSGPMDLPTAGSSPPPLDLEDDGAPAVQTSDAPHTTTSDQNPEHRVNIEAAGAPSASAMLAALDDSAKANAIIELEPVGANGSAWPFPDAVEVAALWNTGHHDRALLALEQLEAEGVRFAPAISWKEPIVSNQKLYYPDARIGGSRTGADDVILDYHSGEGTIFAAVSWADGWSLNISTDKGASWQETYWYSSGASKIGMAVAGDHAWVAYSPAGDPGEARMRRFFADTGAVDGVYWWNLIADVSPAAITDMELGANQDDFQNRVFPTFITDGEDLYFYWANLDGTAFSELSPPVVNANGGLDFTWNTHDSGYSVYISYVNNVDNLIVWRADILGNWDPVMFTAFTGTFTRTGISAHTGTVMVAYDHAYTDGDGARYRVSYNNGVSWSTGDLYAPSPGDPSGWSPDVSLRSGFGSAGIYNREDGTIDNAYVRSRRGYSSGGWSDPLDFSNFDLVSGSLNQIDWIGVTCVGSYGMVYMGDGYIPYFDLMTPRAFFCDGFETGNASAWD